MLEDHQSPTDINREGIVFLSTGIRFLFFMPIANTVTNTGKRLSNSLRLDAQFFSDRD
jgi:hypothetical protein